MSDKEDLRRIDGDLQAAPNGVLYLEGRTDVPILFGLLGTAKPLDNVHHGIGVHGLDAGSGSGGRVVARLVATARTYGRTRVYGITDGDGRPATELAETFDPPFAGPHFTWKTYSIENLLPQAGWPSSWGPAPEWDEVYRRYAPYVALNLLFREIQNRTKTIGIARLQNPTAAESLKTHEEVLQALTKDKALISGFDVVQSFDLAHQDFVSKVATPDVLHSRLSGKWLTRHFAITHLKDIGRPNVTADEAAEEWSAHIAGTGGMGHVREWWTRVTGAPA